MNHKISFRRPSRSQSCGTTGTNSPLRSTALKTAKRKLVPSIQFAGSLVLLGTLVLPCSAIDTATTSRMLAGATVPGQVNSDDAGIQRQQAAQLLKQARQAMERGQLQLAGNYLDRAESLNPQYDAVTVKFQDTPAKVRAELVRNGGAAGSKLLP